MWIKHGSQTYTLHITQHISSMRLHDDGHGHDAQTKLMLPDKPTARHKNTQTDSTTQTLPLLYSTMYNFKLLQRPRRQTSNCKLFATKCLSDMRTLVRLKCIRLLGPKWNRITKQHSIWNDSHGPRMHLTKQLLPNPCVVAMLLRHPQNAGFLSMLHMQSSSSSSFSNGILCAANGFRSHSENTHTHTNTEAGTLSNVIICASNVAFWPATPSHHRWRAAVKHMSLHAGPYMYVHA